MLQYRGASLGGVSEALIGRTSKAGTVVNEENIEKFAPSPPSNLFVAAVRRLNEAMSWRSSMVSETWSSVMWDSMSQNHIVYNALESSDATEEFPKSSLARQLETVSRLIASRKCRGVERDLYSIQIGGYDTHDNMEKRLNDKFEELNESLDAFVNELKAQGDWAQTVVVVSSEFGRTLTPNSRGG
mmetsp:Transcript_1467/g.2773  ORF Transcript_1467/g.2773 Transcript_1467/m.2773 type:complete len:186 (-) Transcript_1467:3009-3566(-)